MISRTSKKRSKHNIAHIEAGKEGAEALHLLLLLDKRIELRDTLYKKKSM